MASNDEKLMDDVIEVEDSGIIETYIRFNDDLEKDYCFQIKSSDTFRDLFKIFKTLPIALRPNLFYNSLPIGFWVSTSPGYLTEDGALLFSYETGQKRFKHKVNNSDKVSNHIWPGQLLLPIWEFNHFGFYSFLSLLLVWLYTDLPDFVSPTPGICLTNQLTKFAGWLAAVAGQQRLSRALLDDIHESSKLAQCLFFVFHILKIGVVFLFIHTGAFNPIKLFKISRGSVQSAITKEQLLEIGWTGTRRACPDEYKDFYREYKIKEHGGLIPAHQAGVFDRLKNLGVFLGEGEGFNTPLDTKSTLKDLLSDDNEKFTLNYQYLAQLGEFFQSYTSQHDSNLVEAIKQFRRYGILHCSSTVEKIVNIRKSRGDTKLD